jgi:hypothetical protein
LGTFIFIIIKWIFYLFFCFFMFFFIIWVWLKWSFIISCVNMICLCIINLITWFLLVIFSRW